MNMKLRILIINKIMKSFPQMTKISKKKKRNSPRIIHINLLHFFKLKDLFLHTALFLNFI